MKVTPFILSFMVLIAGLGGSLILGDPARLAALPAFAGVYFAASDQVLRRDPSAPSAWLWAAEAMDLAGRPDAAEYCVQQAVERGPNIPPVLMTAANYYFSNGKNAEAMALTSRILELTSQYDEAIFSTYRRMGIDLVYSLAGGVPNSDRAYQSYLIYKLQYGSAGEAQVLWNRLIARNAVDDELANRYVTYLIANRMYDSAVTAWSGHLGPVAGPYPGDNRLFNGSFESETGSSPLNWQIRPVDGAKAVRVAVPEGGGFALQVTFDGSRNLLYRHVLQFAPLDPGRYRLEARLRTGGVTTDKGVYLQVAEAAGGRVLARSAELRGDTGWTAVERDFVVAPGARAVVVALCRDDSLRIDSKIAGTAWLDDVWVRRVK